MNFQQQIKQAIQLRKENRLERSNALLVKLVEQYPNDAYVNYQCAWSFDCLGQESKAVPYYEVSIANGLEAEDLQNAYLGLGSTFRALGQYEKSQEIFQQALKDFPENNALKIFYAMTLYNLQQHQAAMSLLLRHVAEGSGDDRVQKYNRAIAFYADNLDDTWT